MYVQHFVAMQLMAKNINLSTLLTVKTLFLNYREITLNSVAAYHNPKPNINYKH